MRVMIAYEGGDASDRAMTAISNWAKTTQADVHLITILHPNELHDTSFGHNVHALTPAGTASGQLLSTAEPLPAIAESRSQAVAGAIERAEEQLRDVANRFLEGLSVEVHADLSDHTAEAIIGAAESLGAELIAMGTHGRSGLSHVLMGSVAEKVVRQSTVPVLVIGPKVGATS